jgi:hypothetical protein
MSKVYELNILENNSNLFSDNCKYIIPLYQRAFAWSEDELIQLVDDIIDIDGDINYYIGSLVVSKYENTYEVIDGQQRLTSLFLLFSCLGLEVKDNLKFACRDKSNYTLNKVKDIINENKVAYEDEKLEENIIKGIKVLSKIVDENDFNRDQFIKKLHQVKLFRIEVPENTDLNRYFEIMNTRGEQLEQHDILKAQLMSYLTNSNSIEFSDEQNLFAMIWDACCDMSGYVPMHFVSKDNVIRTQIFGDNWSDVPSINWEDYRSLSKNLKDSSSGAALSEIIKEQFNLGNTDVIDDDGNKIRFESIIDFNYFLIHTLKVFVASNKVQPIKDDKVLIPNLLDDKKLLKIFDGVIENGQIEGKCISENKDLFAKDFVLCLLRTRYLFDFYIIKREFKNENEIGEWSLKEFSTSGSGSKKKPYYYNTVFKRKSEQDSDYKKKNERNKENLMLQSALRVSYTSPKAMHWITKLLSWLYVIDNFEDGKLLECIDKTEDIAKDSIKKDFFDVCNDDIYSLGVNTPHIVFNYLDYILWHSEKTKYSDFAFEFRNSVEHWYPRNPSEGSFPKWDDEKGVNRFGNLCIVQRNINSKFSNMAPLAKKSTFKDVIDKGSIKLRIMSELTESSGDYTASSNWKDNVCAEHEKKMIDMLKSRIGI